MDARNLPRGQEGALTSLVFPTYNPGPMLERTWRELMQFLQRAPGSWEVLFVCDGCTDGTPARLATLARTEAGRIRILTHAPNRGKGYAVRRGLEEARGEWRLFTDVDLAYSFDDMLRVAEALQAGAPVAIASRTHPESQLLLPARLQGYAYRRHVQSLAFSALVRWLLPLKYRDTQAGLKGLSAAATRKILPGMRCDGFGFDCELLTACVRYGLTVQEVPVCVRYEDRASTTGFGAMKQMLKELWQIRCSWHQLTPPEPAASNPTERQAA
jgi:dolichyl-phosphate beta-glucosyltransferase